MLACPAESRVGMKIFTGYTERQNPDTKAWYVNIHVIDAKFAIKKEEGGGYQAKVYQADPALLPVVRQLPPFTMIDVDLGDRSFRTKTGEQTVVFIRDLVALGPLSNFKQGERGFVAASGK